MTNIISTIDESIPVIDVKKVFKSFKTVQAVKDVTLQIKKGQYVALLGPNGAGKTTLVEMIEGIQKPDQGEISIMGKNWHNHAEELHHLIGLSLQETRFIDKLTVVETLTLFASFFSLSKQRVSEIIEMIGLQEKRKAYVVNLSGGQRQRLTIGIAMLNYPKILLLDEPTTGLDPNARREIWSILFELKETTDTSLILTTHYMEEAERLCDHIIIIDKGEILKQGSVNQLLDEEGNNRIIEFSFEDNEIPSEEILSNGHFQIKWDFQMQKGTVSLQKPENDFPDFLLYLKKQNLKLKNLEWRRKTLDDLFIELTGRHLHE